MWFRFANPFGRAESVYSIAIAALRGRVSLLDRRRRRMPVPIERRMATI